MTVHPVSTWFRAVLGAVLVAVTLSPAVNASHLDAQPLLGTHNTITAMGNSYVDVVLPQDVELFLKRNVRAEAGPASWVTFEGGGRVTGIVLLPKGSTDAISSGLVAVQFRSCRRGCLDRPVNALMINGASFRGRETLDAGEYRLYVLTDGVRTTVRLHLSQLTGGMNIHVNGRTHADFRTPAVHVDRHDDVTAYSAGASYEMETNAGLFMAVNVMRDENYKDASFDECLSRDRIVPDELEETRCPGGFAFVRPLDPTKIQPKRGGFILTTFVGLNDSTDNVVNGDSSLQHYNFRVVSPGTMGELWSQGGLLSYL